MEKQNKTEINETKKLKAFKKEAFREAAVVMAVQNIGVASFDEIVEKIQDKGGKITLKQVEKCCENLQKRGIFSIDLKKPKVKRYLMKRIGVSVPEVGQISAIVDCEEGDSVEIRALIEELEASKKNAKIKPYNYFDVSVTFKTKGRVYGFMPNGNNIQQSHYRDENKNVVFFKKHFRGWLRSGLPLANKYENSITQIFFFNGETNIKNELPTEEQYKTNIPGTHKGAGRGSAILEYLPEGSLIETKFRVPGMLFTPEEFERLLTLTGECFSFGGCNKMSNSQLFVEKFIVGNKVWDDK